MINRSPLLKQMLERTAKTKPQSQLDLERLKQSSFENKNNDCTNHIIVEKWFTANTYISELSLSDSKKRELNDAVQDIASLKLCALADTENDYTPKNNQAKDIAEFLDKNIAVTFALLCQDKQPEDLCKNSYNNLFTETNTIEEFDFFLKLLDEHCNNYI